LIRRSTYYREQTLNQILTLVLARSPGAELSAEALEGIRKSLLIALPTRHRSLRRRLGAGRTANAYNRMASIFMAAYAGQSGVGEFDDLRSAVIEAASSRRAHLDVLAEIHEWLDQSRDPAAVKSQLEGRMVNQGIEIVRTVSEEGRSDDRFRFHGKGDSMTVISPAYVIVVEGKPPVIRQGHVNCEKSAPAEDANIDVELDSSDKEDNGAAQIDVSPSSERNFVDLDGSLPNADSGIREPQDAPPVDTEGGNPDRFEDTAEEGSAEPGDGSGSVEEIEDDETAREENS